MEQVKHGPIVPVPSSWIDGEAPAGPRAPLRKRLRAKLSWWWQDVTVRPRAAWAAFRDPR